MVGHRGPGLDGATEGEGGHRNSPARGVSFKGSPPHPHRVQAARPLLSTFFAHATPIIGGVSKAGLAFHPLGGGVMCENVEKRWVSAYFRREDGGCIGRNRRPRLM